MRLLDITQWLGTDSTRFVLVGFAVLLVIVVVAVVRFISKLAFYAAAGVLLIGFLTVAWSQRSSVSDCFSECSCKLAGISMELPSIINYCDWRDKPTPPTTEPASTSAVVVASDRAVVAESVTIPIG